MIEGLLFFLGFVALTFYMSMAWWLQKKVEKHLGVGIALAVWMVVCVGVPGAVVVGIFASWMKSLGH